MADSLLDDLLDDEAGDPEENFFEEEDIKLEPLLDEVNLITDQAIRYFVRSVLLRADSFWTIPASFSGKFNPPDERGEGGNVLHTKRVVRVLSILCESQDRSPFECDLLYAAAIIHDVTKAKVGLDGKPEYDPMHPYTLDRFVEECIREDLKYTESTNRSTCVFLDDESLAQILRLVRCHLGLWSPIPETYPISTMDWTLHLADHIASKLHTIIDGPDYNPKRWE